MGLFAEIAVMEALEAAAVAGFVFAHLMYRVMDGVEVELLSERGEVFLASASAVLGIDAHLEVLLRGVGEDFAEELCKFRCMFSFVKCVALESFSDFRVSSERS